VMCVKRCLFLRLWWSTIISEFKVKCIFTCDVCNTSFPIQQDLKRHKFMHSNHMVVMRVMCRSVTWVLWKTCSDIIMTIDIHVICVVKVSVIRVTWQYTNVYTLESVLTFVVCVIILCL
jgi:hypothetical protein